MITGDKTITCPVALLAGVRFAGGNAITLPVALLTGVGIAGVNTITRPVALLAVVGVIISAIGGINSNFILNCPESAGQYKLYKSVFDLSRAFSFLISLLNLFSINFSRISKRDSIL